MQTNHQIFEKQKHTLGNALDFTNPVAKQPIVFSEWDAVNGSMMKRRDYMIKFLVEKAHLRITIAICPCSLIRNF